MYKRQLPFISFLSPDFSLLSYLFDTLSSSSLGCSQTLYFPLKDRRACVFSIDRSSSARMEIRTAGDLFNPSARGCSLLSLARSHCQIVEKIVYGQATSFLNRFSPFSKECNLLTTTFAIQSFNKGLKRPFPFNVFIHWHMLAMRFQSPSISHSYPSLLQHLLLTLVLSTCLLLRAIP